MGVNKALTTVGGMTLVERAARLLEELTGTVLIVSRDRSAGSGLPYRVVDSETPGIGPLAALAAGLRECTTPWVLVLACDLPLFPAGLGAYMLAVATAGPPETACSRASAGDRNECGPPDAPETGAGEWQAVVPRWNGFWEPLAAVYARSCLPAIESTLARGERRVASFYGQVRVRPVEEEEIRRFAPPRVAFFNVNSPADLEWVETGGSRRLQELLDQEGQHPAGGGVAEPLG